jgi:DNA polymerase III subunit gamma/tau
MAEIAQSYQVLARKWRPQRFGDVFGQEHVVKTLTNAVAQGRVAHAYLFCGPRGVGKTTAARLLAKALDCEKGPTAEPCGVCAACTEIALGTSVDVPEIDGASNNGVDDVRAIRENARYVPARDRFKIYIIDEVHMLSQAAFNALLKTLEEPPPHVKFIFATTELHKVPETIVSRCQVHTFRRIPLAHVVAQLNRVVKAEGFQLDDAALALIARQAEGGMRDALSLLDQVINACSEKPTPEEVAAALGAVDRSQVLALAKALIERDAGRVVSILGEQYERGTDPRRLCEALCQTLRDLLVTKLSEKPPKDLPDHEQREVGELAKAAEAPQLTRLFELAHEMLGDMGRAFDPRLSLEVALLKGIYLAPGASIAELLARTEALAAGVPLASEVAPTSVPSLAPSRAVLPTAPVPAVVPAAAREPRATPSAPPAPHGTPASVTPQSFAAAAAAVFKQSPRLGTALKNGRLRSLGPGRIALAFPAQDFRASQLLAEKAEVERLLGRELSGAVALELAEGLLENDPPSIAELESQGESARVDRAKEAALSSPAVRDAVRILGGTVEEVRVFGDAPPGKVT